VDTNPADALARLVYVVGMGVLVGGERVGLSENDKAVVGEVFEVLAEHFKKVVLFILEEVLVPVDKLVDNCGQESEAVRQVLLVSLGLSANCHEFLHGGWLSQDWEAVLVVDELLQDSARVQSLLQVVLVRCTHLLEEALDDHAPFLRQHFLHLLLFSRELTFLGFFVAFSIAAITVLPANARVFVFLVLVWLDLDVQQ